MDKREDRRARTWRKAFSRQRQHIAIVHRDGTLDCICETSVWLFDRRRAFGCGCRRHRKGRPRVAYGLCRIGIRDRVYGERREWRELAQRILRRGDFEA